MKKVKVHIAKEVEIEIDDKFDVLDCDTEEWHKRYQEGKITNALMDECIAEVEDKVGVLFFDPDQQRIECINFIEGKHTMLEG